MAKERKEPREIHPVVFYNRGNPLPPGEKDFRVQRDPTVPPLEAAGNEVGIPHEIEIETATFEPQTVVVEAQTIGIQTVATGPDPSPEPPKPSKPTAPPTRHPSNLPAKD
jgi:hypothetical protein